MYAEREWDTDDGAPATLPVQHGLDGDRTVAPPGAGFDHRRELVPTVQHETDKPEPPAAMSAVELIEHAHSVLPGEGVERCQDILLLLLRLDLGQGRLTLAECAESMGEPLPTIKRRSRRLRKAGLIRD